MKPTKKSALVTIACSQIDPSPFQTRQDLGDLRELQESIRDLGQLQPVIVRPKGKRYELVAGERRWRACQALRRAVRAEVLDMDDNTAQRAVVAENLQRKDLNAIEKAHAIKARWDTAAAADPKATISQVAKDLGVSQGYASKMVGLLRLPEAMQKLFLDGHANQHHGVELVRAAEVPGACQELMDELAVDLKHLGHLQSPEDLAVMVDRALMHNTRPMVGKKWEGPILGDTVIFRPTEEQRKALGVVKIRVHGKTEERATNANLWDELRAAQLDAKLAKIEAKQKAKGNGKGNGQGVLVSKSGTVPTATDRKQTDRERRERYQAKLSAVATDHLAYLVARWWEEGFGDPETRAVLFMALLACYWPENCHDRKAQRVWWDAREAMKTAAKELKIPWKESEVRYRVRPHFAPLVCDPNYSERFQDLAIARLLFKSPTRTKSGKPTTKQEAARVLADADVWVLAETMGIDSATRADAWADEQLGPYSYEYWALHSKSQLAGLAAELKVDLAPGSKYEQAQSLLAWIPEDPAKVSANTDYLDFPRELRNIRPRKKPGPSPLIDVL